MNPDVAALQRSVDALTAQVHKMTEEMTEVKVSLATMSGRFTGGIAVIIFLGSVAGAIVAWFLGRHA